jgi:hypothetical protein
MLSNIRKIGMFLTWRERNLSPGSATKLLHEVTGLRFVHDVEHANFILLGKIDQFYTLINSEYALRLFMKHKKLKPEIVSIGEDCSIVAWKCVM